MSNFCSAIIFPFQEIFPNSKFDDDESDRYLKLAIAKA